MEEAAAASCERDEDEGADEIPTHSTPHDAENARNSVKDSSMLRGRVWLGFG
jgi:hypothetical protein